MLYLPERALAPLIRDLVDDQCAVLTRRQLFDRGVTDAQFRAQLEANRWRLFNESVVVLHNGPLTIDQRRWLVYLSSPEPAALAGLTAAAAAGLKGFEANAVHILVQRGAKSLPLPGIDVRVHESRRFHPEDVQPAGRPPRVRPARAVVDAASWSPQPRTASRILVASVQQRICTPAQLHEQLDLAGRIRHRRLLRLLLVDLDGGAQALSEVELLRYCRRHHLPTPALNVRHDKTGRRRYLDALFKRPDGTVLPVEIDGGIHLRLSQRIDDDFRANELFIARGDGMRFTSAVIYADDPQVADQIRRALAMCQMHPLL